MKRLLLSAVLGISAGAFISGCASTTVAPVSVSSGYKLNANAKVYVVVPRNGSYGGKEYQNSGATVADKVRAAFVKHINEIDIGANEGSIEALLAACSAKGYTHVVVPVITHWEDRATEWSGIRDKMELVVKVYTVDSATPKIVSSIVGKSAWATMGGDHPEDLVQVPVQSFVDSLF